MEALRARLDRARFELGGKLKQLGITPWFEPQAGMFLWCRLPEGLDAAEIAQMALAQDIVLDPRQ